MMLSKSEVAYIFYFLFYLRLIDFSLSNLLIPHNLQILGF